jgi:hypothetical protein
MSRAIAAAVFASMFVVAVASQQPTPQYPVMEAIAQKVIEKYQTTPCEQLSAEKAQPPNPQQAQMKAKAVQQLHQDPDMRKAFLDKVAAPIANKMFDCGMIP